MRLSRGVGVWTTGRRHDDALAAMVETTRKEGSRDTAAMSNSDYLRALKRGNEGQPRLDTAASASAGPAMVPESQPSSVPSTEKRRSPRYKCEGSAEFRTEGIEVRTWARVTDLGRSGCYVEMQATSPLNTAVNMMLDVNGIRVRVKGVVRTCYPLLGMGIEFTEIPDEDGAQLDEILRQLAGGFSPDPEPKSSPGADLLMITDVSAALNAVAKFFQTNRALTRDEFTELIGKSQNRNGGRER
jgi:hypothetical protein